MDEFIGKCRICLQNKESCVSLFDMVLDKYLPTVIENVCNVKIAEADEPFSLACNECSLALVEAEKIIQTFRESDEAYQVALCEISEVNEKINETDNEQEQEMEELTEYLDNQSDNDYRGEPSETELEEEMPAECLDEYDEEEESAEKHTIQKRQETYNSKSTRRLHRKSYPIDNLFQCDQCAYKSTFVKYFRAHMIKVHDIENPRIFKCQYCTETFARHYTLRTHVARLHDGPPKHICTECGKRFISKLFLVRHAKQHRPTVRAFPCEHCAMTFPQLSRLKQHMLVEHVDVRMFTCKVCEIVFCVAADLHVHMKRAHSIKLSGDNVD